ncbi:MAG TPA: tetratricopeptide repeat protein [Candidatus Aquilonibacter sp.]|nr:tetratricopeptide repeat protein [Candidatus Aquilonibacter sp.]
MTGAFHFELQRPIARLGRSLLATLALLTASFASESPQDLLDAGRVDQAVLDLNRQIEVAPTAASYNLLCRAQYELGAWDAGIPDCEKAIELAPDNALYHLWLGRIYGEKADHTSFVHAVRLAKKVRAEFELAAEFDPNSCEVRTDLAEFYLEAPGIVGGGKDKARVEVDKLEALNPAMADWVKARLAEKNKDDAAAEREYQAAVTDSHGGARAWFNLASFYHRTGRLDDMERALHALESSRLDHPAALSDGASLVLRTGQDYELGVRLLQRYLGRRTVEEAPAFKAHVMLGELFEKLGNTGAAAVEYRTALGMAHSYTVAEDGLKRLAQYVPADHLVK